MLIYWFRRRSSKGERRDSKLDSTDAGGGTPSRRWTILLCISLLIPVFFETLDYTVVATAQVHIASAFNRLDLQSWIGTAYLLTSTVFLPLFASIADIWGRHSALQVALLLFMTGSAISTGSQNMVTMLAGRGVAGIGAAGQMTVVRVIMADSGSLNANNWQQAMLFFLYTIGYCIGPFIGGELLTVSFRWIFAINLPACAVAIVLAFFILRGRTKGPQGRDGLPAGQETFLDRMFRVDWIGAFLFMAGGIAVMLALNWGSTYGWNSARVIVCFVTGGFAYIIFLGFEHILERRSSLSSSVSTGNRSFWTQPMLPISIFRSLDISITQYATLVSGMVLIVMFYFVAVFMVIVAGRSASNAGVQLIYFAPGMGAGSLLQIRLIKQYRQPKYPIMLGSLVLTISLGLISMAVEKNNTGMIAGFMVISGVGVGLSIGALAIHARFSQPADKVAIVSALLLFSRSLGGTIGLAQCGAVLDAKVRQYITSAVESGAIPDSAAIASSLASLGSLQNINSLPPAVQTIVRDAYRDGTRWAFISLIPWAALGFLGTLCLSNIKDSDAAPSDKEEIPVEVLEDTNI